MHIQFDKIGYTRKKAILSNVNLEFKSETIVGLVAPNGMGKSTLFKGIMNSLNLIDGNITINNQTYHYPLTNREQVELYKNVSMMVDQKDLIDHISGKQHLEFAKKNWQSSLKIDEIIELLDVGSYINNKVSSYSLGMRQRLCFAMQILSDTPIMLMDEVMNSLDILNVNIISNILLKLREQGKIIITASHLLDNLSLYCDQVIFITHSKELLMIDTNNLEKILTLLVRRNQSIRDVIDEEIFREPFTNKFQIDLNQVDLDEITNLINRESIRSVSIGDKSITDYYHELYL